MTEHVRTIFWLALLLGGIVLSGIQLGADNLPVRPIHEGHHHGNQHEPHRLYFWEPEQVRTLLLQNVEGQEKRFTRDAYARWTSPQGASAGAFDAEAYVSLLSRARIDREFPADKETLHTYGLSPALLRVRVLDANGSVLADLIVGERTPDGYGRYVFVPTDSNVLIIPNYQFEAALRALHPAT